MTKNFDPMLCDDKTGHERMWALHRFFKDARDEGGDQYEKAFGVLNEGFGAEIWPSKKRKGECGSHVGMVHLLQV